MFTGEPGLVALLYCRAGGVAVGCPASVFLASALRIKHQLIFCFSLSVDDRVCTSEDDLLVSEAVEQVSFQ